jgi:hypothetical protein
MVENVVPTGPHAREPTTLSPTTRRWVLVAAVLLSSMVFLDGATVNAALPALQASHGESVVDVQWVVNGYTLFLASRRCWRA